jgi:hypothetical protein
VLENSVIKLGLQNSLSPDIVTRLQLHSILNGLFCVSSA